MSIKVYLAGPMRGKPGFNFPAFFTYANALRYDGYVVFNPAEKDIENYGEGIAKNNPEGSEDQATIEYKFNLRKALQQDIDWICSDADAIAMMPGWEDSKGARAEYAVAVALGLEIIIL